jgi:hypothetical protein
MAVRLRASHSLPPTTKARFSNPLSISLPSSRIARAAISNMGNRSRHSPKPLSYRVSESLPEGWTKRRLELTALSNNSSSHQQSRQTRKKEPALNYKEYKDKYLKSYSEYHKECVEDYLKAGRRLEEIDQEKINKSYEIYCKSSYNSYTVQLKQDNPGFIL